MKQKSKVAIVYLDNYDFNLVYKAVSQGVEAIGGIESFILPKESILVKPNFLYPSEVEKTVTTNPIVIEAVLKLLNDNGYHIVNVGDSCASGSCVSAINKLGLNEEKLHGAKIASMDEEVLVNLTNGNIAKKLYLCKDAIEADAIIGISKMKTHMLERITGAVKNMYGLICGYRKAQGHVKFRTANTFARMLCDIHNSTNQRLHIMDGIIAMEGNGPASGNPIKMNLLLFSSDPVAIDTVFARLIHLKPELVPTIVQGQANNLGTYDFNNIDLTLIKDDKSQSITIDELVNSYGKVDFDVQREREKLNILQLWSTLNGAKAKPQIDPNKCVKCGICVNHCPVEGKAVEFKNGKNNPPVYNYKKCIRCFCCQELCPQHAISVKR